MLRFAQHPDLPQDLAKIFREQHQEIFGQAEFISTNNEQVVKSFDLNGDSFIIKRYPEKGPRGNLRSLLGISRAVNSLKKAAEISKLGVNCPTHLFVARHIGLIKGRSYLIMKKSLGTSLHPMIIDKPHAPISDEIIANVADLTHRIHRAGFSHGDLHAGNIFVLPDHSVEIIDLDNFRPNTNRQEKDRLRLLRSFDSRPRLIEKLAKALTQKT
ncbi:MAG: tRNA A-37 threonylcarbamoyl transferase component Bud32 [Paracoccaceae bacterium]|jgi:tRNA A-37 threonylcarbamoyl transferase component Bud32